MKNQKITIQNKELEVLLELKDSKYGKIKRCLCDNKLVYIIQNQMIEDTDIINKLEIKYGFMIPNKLKNIIY